MIATHLVAAARTPRVRRTRDGHVPELREEVAQLMRDESEDAA